MTTLGGVVIGSGFVALLVLCAIGIYLHLWQYHKNKLQDIDSRQKSARSILNTMNGQTSAIRRKLEEEDTKGAYWHLEVVESSITSVLQWLR